LDLIDTAKRWIKPRIWGSCSYNPFYVKLQNTEQEGFTGLGEVLGMVQGDRTHCNFGVIIYITSPMDKASYYLGLE
jgi:hypothetical protein